MDAAAWGVQSALRRTHGILSSPRVLGGPISPQGPSWPKPILGGAESWASLQGTVQALACISGRIPEPDKAREVGSLFVSHSFSLSGFLGVFFCPRRFLISFHGGKCGPKVSSRGILHGATSPVRIPARLHIMVIKPCHAMPCQCALLRVNCFTSSSEEERLSPAAILW